MDITDVILSDHEEQRLWFSRLDQVDRSDIETLGIFWRRISTMLEVHAEAEEQFFYPELLALGKRLHDAIEAEETDDAIGDHNDIRDGIVAASRHDVGSEGWWAGLSSARKANDEHMGEEEHEGLREFRLHVDAQTRHRIAVRFLAFEASNITGVPIVDKDPQRYVDENS